ncbi:MAG TPA: hypothetical protein VGO91_18645 [Pyrinomonadaceae bacterium]|jgi:hypothetical protein|nr:hypothetical protein [Pyrinomonadaceae bacterium]
MVDATYTTPPEVGRYQTPALVVGVVFLALSLLGLLLHQTDNFFRAYLMGYLFWTGIALGSLAVLMLQHLTGGAWGMVIRRVLESSTRTLPLLLLLFVPIILGMHSLYEWTHQDKVNSDEILKEKSVYLNIPFFAARVLIYFAIWLSLMYLLNKWSGEQDRTAEQRYSRQMRMLSGPGLVLFVLTVTFASIDWAMSLDPHWFSTIWGLLFVAQWGLSSFAFVIALMALLSTRAPFKGVVSPAHFHDLGKLLLAFVMVWAYFNFSQYLIIWSGNIPEETKWFIPRQRGWLGAVAILVIIFHFALPFLMLLSRDLKRNARLLAGVAGLVLLMRLVDLFWIVAPRTDKTNFDLSGLWLYFVAPIGLGGIWLWYFATQLRKRPLLPLNDPYLEEALEHGKHGGH